MYKKKLRTLEGGMVAFYCKGCKQYHGITVEGEKHPKWDFNRDFEKPTFSPSIMVEIGHYPEPSDICHSFVNDGKIQYLSDCTHELAGQTIDLEEED